MAPVLLSISLLTFKRVALVLIIIGYLSIFIFFHVLISSTTLHYTEAILGPQIPLFIGALTALFVCEGKLVFPPLSSIVLVVAMGISLLTWSGLSPVPLLFRDAIPICCFSILIVAGIQKSDSLAFRILNCRVLRKIGILSYSLYIWQQIFTYDQFMFFDERHVALSILINLTMLGLVASMSYYFAERYFLALKSHLVR